MGGAFQIDRLHSALAYDPLTGVLTWRIATAHRVNIGDRAGTLDPKGVRRIGIDGFKFTAARVAWAMSYGEWPANKLIHDNGDRDDNSIENLRAKRRGDTRDLTAARLRELFEYDPETGALTRRCSVTHNTTVGAPTGVANGYGYLVVGIDGRNYLVHRVAWFIMTGEWPTGRIDHKNGVGVDNRWENLRDATPAMNCQNQRRPHVTNTSGFLGVSKSRGRWKAQISVGGANRFIGRFDTAEQAHAEYIKAKRILHEGNLL